jgi:hypothetical protein
MKTVIRRLTKLEHQLGYSGKPRERFRMVIRRADSDPTLEGATCKRTLCPNQSARCRPRDRFRMVIRRADSAPTLEGATCKRSLCPDGSLFEFVKFLEPSDGSHELSQEEIDRWVETFPIG